MPQWDLSIAYDGVEDARIETDLALVRAAAEQLGGMRGQEGDVTTLQHALELVERARIIAQTVAQYCRCVLSVDSSDSLARKLSGRVDALLAELRIAYEPFHDQLLRMAEDGLDQIGRAHV